MRTPFRTGAILATAIVMTASTAALPALAQDTATQPPKPLPPIELTEPTTVESCLQLLERVIQHAEAVDMLDDQVDKAEAELERMDISCREQRFPDAYDAAKAVEALMAANK